MNDTQIAAALQLIELGNALNAEVEYDLEDRGLITTDDAPYASLTDEGRAFVENVNSRSRISALIASKHAEGRLLG